MRRTALTFAISAAVGTAALIVLTSRDGASGYRVSAVFDSARGIEGGMTVKIAGARVGKVRSVHLTASRKARIDFEVPARFGPFHADARCRILPEGAISENYVACIPGTPGRPILAAPGGRPVVPLSHTTVPVTLQDVIEIFGAPVNQRLRVMFNELGLATAGEGDDINAIVRRANPALTQTRRVLAIINAQRQQVAKAVGQTDRVLAQLAHRRGEIRTFVDQAAAVTRTTSAHRVALGQLFRRLPPLLTRLRRSSASLDDISTSATPLLAKLREAAPSLTALSTELPRFLSPATPAIRTLGSAAQEGRVMNRSARPVVSHLRTFAGHGRSPVDQLDLLLSNMRQQGAFDGLLDFVYAGAQDEGPYDSISHMSGFVFEPTPCAVDPSGAKCNHNYYAELGLPSPNADHSSRPRRHERRHTAPSPTRSAPGVPSTHPPGMPSLPLTPGSKPEPLPLPGALPLPGGEPRTPGPGPLGALLQYLLG